MSDHLNPANVQQRLSDAHEAGKVTTAQQLADFSTDLLDSEIKQAVSIVASVQRKYYHKKNTVENLEKLRDEVLTRLSEIGILASFDPTPCFYGDPPECEFIGKVNTDPIHTQGFDHAQKKFEVQTSKERGEHYYGEREPINPKSKAAKRERSRREAVRKLQEGETDK